MTKKIFVDVIIPVYNEESALNKNILILKNFLEINLKQKFKIIIVDNASIDNTSKIGKNLAKKFTDIEYIYLGKKGRGGALRYAWMKSKADIVSYMDVDLSTDLKSFPIMISALISKFDLASGSRLVRGARIKRSFKRELLSRIYNLLLRMVLLVNFKDAQCGFKAARINVAKDIIPRTKDNNWFFDSELMIVAEKKGYKIIEIPVNWIEDPDSKVNLVKTSLQYLKGIVDMRLRLWRKKFI
jgi:glycosyltransferase involved in cell wall biosynthesis